MLKKFAKLIAVLGVSLTVSASVPATSFIQPQSVSASKTANPVLDNKKFTVPVDSNKTTYINVPYVSQYRPINAPWGCAEASLTMLLRSAGVKVDLRYIFNHTPMYPKVKGGQKGNVYTGAGFGHVITAAALTKYAHHWSKRVHNVSGSSVATIKRLVQSGHPVLFYGYSSYQRPADLNRNHCKVITAYKNGKFRVYDPLYYSKNSAAGTQGRNMTYDRGAVSWYTVSRFSYEYAHLSGNNKKSALSVY